MVLPELPDDRRARPRRVPPGGAPHAVRTPPEGQPSADGFGSGRSPAPDHGDDPDSWPTTPYSDGLRSPSGRDPAEEPTQNLGPPVESRSPELRTSESQTSESQDVDDEPADDPLIEDLVQDAGAQVPPEFPGRHRRRAGESPDERPAAAYRARAEADRKASGAKKAKPGRRRRDNFWRELPVLIVVALVMTFLIQTFLAKVYIIPSGSMETTLHGCTGCNNDRILVDKLSFRFGEPQPGDVVVFRGPDSWVSEISTPPSSNPVVNGLQQFGSLIGLAPPDERDFVKRVIAVGGQTVQCCDTRNRVLVDGEPLDEPYIYYLPAAGAPRQETFDPVLVPEGQLWLMGDSRNNSADSRVPGHGPVPVENVIGQARLIVLPIPRFRLVPSIDPHPVTAVGLGSPGTDGVPLALGLIGTLPVAIWRRRRSAEEYPFLPDR